MRDEQFKEHMISILVYNKPGVAAKITGLITRRGFNIESISGGKAKEKGMFRFIIVVKGDDRSIEQIEKQLYKVIETVKVSSINPESKVEREMALVKVKSSGFKDEILRLVDVFRGKIVDASIVGVIVEITGSKEKIDAFLNLIDQNMILSVSRTGIIAMNRWSQAGNGEQ